MSFARNQILKVVETDELFRAFTFKAPYNHAIRWIRPTLFNKGVTVGKLRVGIFTDPELERALAWSDWIDIAEVATSIGGFGSLWRGFLAFEFPAPYPRLEAGVEYRLGVFVEDYTRNGFDQYLAFALDWPLEVNDNQDDLPGLAAEIYTYRRVN